MYRAVYVMQQPAQINKLAATNSASWLGLICLHVDVGTGRSRAYDTPAIVRIYLYNSAYVSYRIQYTA